MNADSQITDSAAQPRQRSQEAETNIAKLREKLRELFQLHRGDLDFGLYRIMAHKSAAVEKFMNEQLLPQVTKTLREVADRDAETTQAKIAKARNAVNQLDGQAIQEFEPTIKGNEEELRRRIQATQKTEAETYNHLCNFFARYYDEGDFMSLRRYKGSGKEAYAIPYNGEEVKLHWANSDQYYIKTTENYASYAFIVGDAGKQRRVCFQIAAADNEKDSIKAANDKQRLFVLAKDFIAERNDELIIKFEHRPLRGDEKAKYPKNGAKQQCAINQHAEQRIAKKLNRNGNGKANWSLIFAPCPTATATATDNTRTVLGKHLTAYTAKNSFDYFIHKDLSGFLRRELDAYLKSEVLSIDNLELTDDQDLFKRKLAQVKVIKKVGEKIIAFLAQLEDFQKQLWLKKKFVLATQYCVTIDKISESLYAEIAANQAQHAEWIKLFAINELNGDLAEAAYSDPLTVEFLKSHPYLVLDTRHFSQQFTDQLLADLSQHAPLHEQMDGLLVHGENFQALNLLHARYREQVKCIYIDPPYNTDASSILYKNGYKDSSWLSLMENRLALSYSLLQPDGIICAAIDDTEVSVLRMLMEDIFAAELGIVPVRSNPAGRKTKGRFAPAHEYALFYGKAENSVPGSLGKTEKQKQSYPHEDEQGRFNWMNFVRSGTNDRREDRPKLFYPIYVDDKDGFRVPNMEWSDKNREWVAQDLPADSEVVVYPLRKVGTQLVEGNWHRGHQRIIDNSSDYRVRRVKGNEVKIQFKVRLDEDALPKTWWEKGGYQSANGTNQLKAVLGDKEFDFPKSPELVKDCLISSMNGGEQVNVLDFFAGSGTTGHVLINLNRENSVNHKYVLVEMGHHFETVLLPRMKKVIYAKDWKDGKPKDQQNRAGMSQCFQYIKLESYEDTMDSLIVKQRSERDFVDDANRQAFKADYQLHYALGDETSQSASLLGKDFMDPFNYTLSVVRDGIKRDETVDLAETFNFLLGLKPTTRATIDNVLTITGTTRNGANCLILWRNLKQINATELNKWFAKHRDTFGANINKIYVNGDHILCNMRTANEKWDAVTTEPVFRELMFESMEA